MSETQVLLGKITALRQRLEQAQGLAQEADSAAVALWGEGPAPVSRIVACARQVAVGAEYDADLDRTVRPLTAAVAPDEGRPLPRQLTSRARRVLERGRDLLARLRPLADAFAPDGGPAAGGRADPLARLYRE